MEPRISVLTIAADDLAAMKSFYSDVIGWAPIAENKDIVFYKLNGFLLSICDRKLLADFIGTHRSASGFRSVTIGYNVDTEDAVSDLYNSLKDKVTVIKAPTRPPFGGLFFYFQDIEGNVIEVANNPFVMLDDESNATGHKPIDQL